MNKVLSFLLILPTLGLIWFAFGPFIGLSAAAIALFVTFVEGER